MWLGQTSFSFSLFDDEVSDSPHILLRLSDQLEKAFVLGLLKKSQVSILVVFLQTEKANSRRKCDKQC